MPAVNEYLFMPIQNMLHLIPLSVWGISIASLFLINMGAVFFYNHTTITVNKISPLKAAAFFFYEILKKPLFVLAICYGLYLILHLVETNFTNATLTYYINYSYLFSIFELLIFFWFILHALEVGKTKLIQWSQVTGHKSLNLLLPAIANSLIAAIFLLMINMLIPELHFSGLAGLFVAKAAKVTLICIISWIFVQAVNVFERFVMHQYIADNENHFAARKITTQLLILKRVIIAIAMVVTVASILMVFDTVKNVGTGLLTTAGIISAIGAFASQQSLGRIFAGLQIAFTQPIRIGDTVIIDNEFGQVEEITLSYVIIKLWDLRCLILPTDYFTSKGLQNLTRNSTELLGTIFLHTDFTLPVEEVRKKFNELLAASKRWDGKVSGFQVTDSKDVCMEIRALVSAENASVLWALRCEIREELIRFIAGNYPECLPRTRSMAVPIENK